MSTNPFKKVFIPNKLVRFTPVQSTLLIFTCLTAINVSISTQLGVVNSSKDSPPPQNLQIFTNERIPPLFNSFGNNFLSINFCTSFQSFIERFNESRRELPSFVIIQLHCLPLIRFHTQISQWGSTTFIFLLNSHKEFLQFHTMFKDYLNSIPINNKLFAIVNYPLFPSYYGTNTNNNHLNLNWDPFLRGEGNNTDIFEQITSKLSERYLSNFDQRELRVSAVMDENYEADTNIRLAPNGDFILVDGFAVEILRSLEYTINFKTVLKVEMFWGHKVNNSWVGMIQSLIMDEADLGLSSIADLPFRREVVDFNMPTNNVRLTTFFQKPVSSSKETALSEPFQTSLWLVSIITFGISAILIISFEFIHIKWYLPIEKLAQEDSREESDAMGLDINDTIFLVIGSVCQKGFPRIPEKFCYRMAIITVYFSSLLLFSVYSSTIISFLSVEVDLFTNLGQLASSPSFQFIIQDSPIPEKFLRESPNEVVQTIYRKRRKKGPKYTELKDVKKELLSSKRVFVSDHISGYDSLNNEFNIKEACRIKELRIPNGDQKQGTIVQANSPYKRIIDYQILRMHEYGLIQRWSSRYLLQKPYCEQEVVYDGVDFISVALSLKIYGILLVISLLSFIIERYYRRRTRFNFQI